MDDTACEVESARFDTFDESYTVFLQDGSDDAENVVAIYRCV